MSVLCSFRVDGVPKSQPRGKVSRHGKFAGIFDPGTADGWKGCVKLAALPCRPTEPWDCGLMVTIEIELPRPQAKCRKKDPKERLQCFSGKDVDNLAKAVLDALTDVGMWTDDSRISSLTVRKFYHGIGARPGANIVVETAERNDPK